MKFKRALKKFGYETFRPRTRADYGEIFTRGGGGEGSVPYPWFYSRVLLLCFFLFALISFGYSLSGLNFIAVVFAGGALADLVFVVFLYELYPKRDIPLIAPLAALFAGGILSSAVAYLLYSAANVSSPYAMQAWTAFVEETAKGVTVIAVLALVKKKNPYVCFLMGAAVGGGFSALENMWYAFTGGFASYSLPDAMEILLFRSFGTPFSHAAWASAFGWAVSSKKPYKKPLPYLIFAFNYVMHFFVNFPLMEQFEGWKGYPISAATGVASFVLIVFIIVISRREFFPSETNPAAESTRKAQRLPKINSLYAAEGEGCVSLGGKKIAANVFGAVAIVCFGFALMGHPLMFRGYRPYEFYDFDDFAECRALAQSGLEFHPDFEREFVVIPDVTQNFTAAFTEGQLNYVVQREESGEYFYRYRYAYKYYNFTKRDKDTLYVRYKGEDVPAYSDGRCLNGFEAVMSETDPEMPERMKRWELQTVFLEFNGGLYQDLPIYRDDNTLLHTFILNPACYSLYVTSEGKFRAVMDEDVPLGVTETIIFSVTFAAAAVGAGAAYLIEKFKYGRYKNVE